MFALSQASHASTAYRQVGVETGVGAASSHELVSMLYSGFFDALAQARGALLAGQIEQKGRAIGRAVRIVEEGLRSCLDDRRGGQLAANLNSLYGYVVLRLTQANLYNDAALLDECAQLIEPVRAAWQAIGPRATAATQ
ncbi:MAG: flagellar export chaperone FliS [Rhizobacter sp.]|jgi:flagellar protein FliS|nr:flagellar export chaperone FliS [Burkholderiaceae bacterium]MCO5123714.1 flagellar export chaperone FliS [Rhizobacter sp.]